MSSHVEISQESMNPVGVFGLDIETGARYVAIASLIKTILYTILEASRILYTCRWINKHPAEHINRKLVKVLKPNGIEQVVIGGRIEILGRYCFNPTCILIALISSIAFEVVWYFGITEGCWTICIFWFVVMGIGITMAIIEDRSIPGISELFILYQMWVMVVYMKTF